MTQVEIRLEHIPYPLLEDFELGESSFSLRVQVRGTLFALSILFCDCDWRTHFAIPEEMPISRRA